MTDVRNFIKLKNESGLNMSKQMSESFPVGVLLAISGGLMDAYSYLYRGHVFANAQTGNVLMFSIHLSKGEWMSSLHYALPIIAFLSGVALSTCICHFCKQRELLHWRQICVLFEAVIFLIVAVFSQEMNLPANCLISLACGIQVETFRRVENENVATTMCIGNMRSAIHSAIMYGLVNNHEYKHSTFISFSIVLSFAFGAIMGSILIKYFGAFSISFGSAIMLVCFFLMFVTPSDKRNNHINNMHN